MARSFFAPILVILSAAFVCVVFMDRIIHFHAEYMKFSSQLEMAERMIDICRNESHKDILSAYTSVCLDLESNARIGAFMLALNTVTGAAHFRGAASELWHSARALGWPVAVLLLVAAFLCPGACIQYWRRRPPPRPAEWRDDPCSALQPVLLRRRGGFVTPVKCV